MIESNKGPRKGSKGCLRCIYWCYCLLLLLIVITAAIAWYLYIVYKPKAPTYDIQSFAVKSFDLQPDFTLEIEFLVDVTARNPNEHIGFIYGANSNVSVIYNDAVISSGKLPAFRQDPGNTKVMKVTLAGTSPNDSDSLQDNLANNKQDGGIPLQVKVRVPVKIFVGSFEFRQFMAYVKCDLVVDNLEPGKPAKVVKNECRPDVGF